MAAVSPLVASYGESFAKQMLEMVFSGRLDSVRLMVVLDGLKVFSNLNDSRNIHFVT